MNAERRIARGVRVAVAVLVAGLAGEARGRQAAPTLQSIACHPPYEIVDVTGYDGPSYNDFFFSEAYSNAGNYTFGHSYSRWHAPLGVTLPNVGVVQTTPCGGTPTGPNAIQSGCYRLPAEGSSGRLLGFTRPVDLETRGFPLNMNVFSLPRMCNFPPLSQDPVASTAPFISERMDHAYRPLFLADRRLIGGVVDPITGQPLIREVDLELPVGRATYRLIRTYGGSANGMEGGFFAGDSGSVLPYYWDWCGTGWMLSEDPVLLFDALYLEHDVTIPRTCYLLLDAHHSIPFTQNAQTGEYASPAWFDAVLTHNGDWDAAGEAWMPGPDGEPTELTVALFGGAVRYIFSIEKKDMIILPFLDPDDPQGIRRRTAHAAPQLTHRPGQSVGFVEPFDGDAWTGGPQNTSGLGAPYFCLLTRMEDGFGNCAKITHTNVRERADPGPGPDANCVPCTQNCTEKGQIKTVELWSGGECQWTLLYVHRNFRLWAPDADSTPCTGNAHPWLTTARDTASRWFLQNALHAVYVYKGYKSIGDRTDTSANSSYGSWTIPAEEFVRQNNALVQNLDEQDGLPWDQIAGVDPGWLYRIRYTYDEVAVPLTRCGLASNAATFSSPFPSTFNGIFRWGTPTDVNSPEQRLVPSLLRVERSERRTPDSPIRRSYTAYTYATESDAPPSLPGEVQSQHGRVVSGYSHTHVGRVPKLKNIIRDDGLDRIVAHLKSERAITDATINSIFDGVRTVADTGAPGGSRALNQLSYDDWAEISLEWSPPDGETAATSAWMQSLITGCVLNKVERGRITVESDRRAMVSRLRVNGRGYPADGWYDLLYFVVAPSPGSSSPSGDALLCTDVVNPATPVWYVGDGSVYGGEQGLCAGPYHFLTSNYSVFPFRWRSLGFLDVNSGNPSDPVVDASSLSDVKFMALVDKHDGKAVVPGSGGTPAPPAYSMKYLMTSEGSNALNRKPASRELVGLNGAGFVLFSRGWDYKGGGVNAVGPMEEFIYDSTPGPVDALGKSLTGAIRLREKRSLGWSVAYINDVNRFGGNANGGGGGCNPLDIRCGDGGPPDDFPAALRGADTPGPPPPGAYQSATAGLITTYDYAGASSLLKRLSVKEGVCGEKRTLMELFFEPGSGGRVVGETHPVFQPDSTQTFNSMTRATVREFHDAARTLLKKETTFGAPAGDRPSGADLRPYVSMLYDDKGFLRARSYGLAADPLNPNTGDEPANRDVQYVDVYGYDARGLRVLEVVDADLDQFLPPEPWTDHFHRLPGTGSGPDRPPNFGEILAAVPELPVRHVPVDVRHLLETPLHRCTGYAYNEFGQMEITAKPGDRFEFFVLRDPEFAVSPEDDRKTCSAVYLDGVFDAADGTLKFGRPGQIAGIDSSRPIRTFTAVWSPVGALDNDDLPPPGEGLSKLFAVPASDPIAQYLPRKTGEYLLVAEVTPTYDNAGRVNKIHAEGLDNQDEDDPQRAENVTEPIEREAKYTDFGLIAERIEPSGTHLRTVTSPIGQLLAEFRGTKSGSACWQNGTSGDNMLLLRRHFYGEGLNDIRQPVKTRFHRDAVICDDVRYDGTADTEQESGWEQVYGHDRRMRRVAVDSFSEGPTRSLLRSELTWLDHQGRKRFAAVFDPAGAQSVAGSAQIDPRQRDVYSFGEPTAGQILAHQPLRLSETMYNLRGQVEEEREYDCTGTVHVAGASGPTFTATRMYYDQDGRVQYRASSSGRLERSTYNAIGQLVSTTVLRGDDPATGGVCETYEVERTDNRYHPSNNQVEVSSHVVRVINDDSRVLVTRQGEFSVCPAAAPNAVRTDTVNWYDENNRSIATASVGTASDNGLFNNMSGGVALGVPPQPSSPAGDSRGTLIDPPVWRQVGAVWTWAWPQGSTNGRAEWLDFARITATTYDKQGRASVVRGPSGSVVRRVYDGFNRVTQEWVMPPGPSGDLLADATDPTVLSQTRLTAYRYDRGQLKAIAAVRPQFGRPGGVVSINWDGPKSPNIQITKLVYLNEPGPGAPPPGGFVGAGAEIVDASGAVVSNTFELPAGIIFDPGGASSDFNGDGQKSVGDVFAFLTAYFAHEVHADANGDGQLTVADLFYFLQCYFSPTGCGRRWNTGLTAGSFVPDIKFQYTVDGLLRTRTDLLGDTLTYGYDVLGRRTTVDVARSTSPTARPAGVPTDAVESLSYTYDLLDRLTGAVAWTKDAGGNLLHPVAAHSFTHDPWGNLTGERLAHGAQTTAGVAPIAYVWGYDVLDQPAGGSADGLVTPRLASMTNPVAAGTPGDPLSPGALRSTVGYSYGAKSQGTVAGLDNAMMRVQSVSWAQGGTNQPPARTLAAYRYLGAGMLAGLTFFGSGPLAEQPVLAQGFADPANAVANPIPGGTPAVAGLDRFGQVSDLRFVQASAPQSPTAFRGEYAYDASGNLAVERVTQQPVVGGPTPTDGHDRSWLYGYDRLDRLISAATGTLDPAEPVALETGFASNQGGGGGVNFGKRFSQDWKGLDDLGNWTTPPLSPLLPPGTPGLEETAFSTASGAATSTTKTSHSVDVRNEIRAVTTKVDAAQPQAKAYVYDNAGRMVSDGVYFYEHDFFGRLVQVRRANGAVAGHDDGSYTVSAAALGRLVVHFTYDALGRLIRVQRPENDNTGAQDTQTIHVTDLYYDGVRVIQEVGWTNLAPRLLPVAPGNPGNWYGPRRADELAPTSAPWSGRRAEREYVWAADPGGYVDECLAQVCYTDAHAAGSGQQAGQEVGDDTVPTFLYCITDAHKNLAALADDGGNVVAQYSYTPYGQVRAADYGPVNDPTTPYQEAVKAARGSRLTHQGLRFERLDAPWKGGSGTTTLNSADASAVFEPSTPNYNGLCHNRNRCYFPGLGRFGGDDPKGLAIPVLSELAYGGSAPTAVDITPDLVAHVGDGMNSHAAYGAQPFAHRDPLGLDFSLGQLAASSAISGLVGGLFNGALSALNPGGGSFWEKFASGFGRGFVAGAAGGAAGYAFAASAAGLGASILAKNAIAGAAGGFYQGYVDAGLRGESLKIAIAEGLSGAAIGTAAGVALPGAGAYARDAYDSVIASVTRTSTKDLLDGLVERAFSTIGNGSGAAHGSRVHKALADLVRALNRPNLHAEQSYLNKQWVRYGTPGSVRVDIVEGSVDSPHVLYDLKSGAAKLTPARIAELRQHVPGTWTIEELR